MNETFVSAQQLRQAARELRASAPDCTRVVTITKELENPFLDAVLREQLEKQRQELLAPIWAHERRCVELDQQAIACEGQIAAAEARERTSGANEREAR